MSTDRKFKSLVHYVCSRRRDAPESLGAVKLNKILWLADLGAFYETGSPITDSRYIKKQFGPVPAAILPVVRQLEQEGVLTVKDTRHFGKDKKEYWVHKPSDGSFLNSKELLIVDRVIDRVCDEHTAASVSAMSHDHIWEAADDGEEIPHFTVFAKKGKITDSERAWAAMKLESSPG